MKHSLRPVSGCVPAILLFITPHRKRSSSPDSQLERLLKTPAEKRSRPSSTMIERHLKNQGYAGGSLAYFCTCLCLDPPINSRRVDHGCGVTTKIACYLNFTLPTFAQYTFIVLRNSSRRFTRLQERTHWFYFVRCKSITAPDSFNSTVTSVP